MVRVRKGVTDPESIDVRRVIYYAAKVVVYTSLIIGVLACLVSDLSDFRAGVA
jgi:hypothetical protein